MMEWVRLGDIATYINGYAFKPTQWKETGIPIIRIQNLTNSNSSYNYTNAYLDDRYKVDRGDILISWSATLDVYEWDKDLAYLNQHIFKVEFNKIEINKDFFKYFVKYALILSAKNAHGSTMKHLTRKNFEKIKIPKFPLELQNSLANLLNKVTGLIKIRKKQIQAYDDLIESLFFEMFGDIRFNNNNFSMKKWKDVLNIVNGKNQKKVENPNGKYPIYGSGGIMSYADDWLTKENSIIIGRKGNINKPIFVKEKFWNVDTAFGLEPLEDLINADYLFGFCKIFNFERLNKAVTIPSLTKKDLLDIDIPVPPIEMQNKFADYVVKIEEEKKKLRESLEELETLFDALMQDAFSGNLFKD